MAVRIETRGLTELQGRLRASPAELASRTRDAMQASLIQLEGTARRLAPRDTGRLQGSITHTIEGSGANLTGRVGPSVRYGYWVEYGRRPGRQPPLEAIAGWARRHGAHPFMIARAIGRRGTRPQPYMQPAFTQHAQSIVSRFKQIGVKIAAFIAH